MYGYIIRLQKKNKELLDEISSLNRDCHGLSVVNDALRDKNKSLRNEIEMLRADNERLIKENIVGCHVSMFILKTEAPFYQYVIDGKKTFELRKDDRNFHVGDWLRLQEVKESIPTGRECEARITYIFRGPLYGLEAGYVILSIGSVHEVEK